ncbi:hypothetical protein Hanom_Chr11g00983881 [Helianthus anomalus]
MKYPNAELSKRHHLNEISKCTPTKKQLLSKPNYAYVSVCNFLESKGSIWFMNHR